MLHLYRRHSEKCPHKQRGMNFRKCRCPIWVHGKVRGIFIRRSLETLNWETAHKIAREMEDSGIGKTMTVKAACERFTEDCKARHLRLASLGKYKLLTDELTTWFEAKKLESITVDGLREYRESWKMSPISSRKKLERLRTFFKFCQESGWIKSNPAKVLKPPREHPQPTLPLTRDQFEKIEWATQLMGKGVYGEKNQIRVRAFVRLLRYSGLRIRDAVLLTDDKVVGNRIMLYSAKTGVSVYVPLPDFVVKDLEWAYELSPGKYFFWSGSGDVKSCVNDWQRSLKRVSDLAGVKFHAHQLRDTFAVELLQKRVSLENVATLLGNTIKIAEKHYAPWVKSRQVELEKEIEKAWKLN
jgi:integrase/recombinase XerD